MKKIITIAFILISSVCFGEIKIQAADNGAERKGVYIKIEIPIHREHYTVTIKTACFDGLMLAVLTESNGWVILVPVYDKGGKRTKCKK